VWRKPVVAAISLPKALRAVVARPLRSASDVEGLPRLLALPGYFSSIPTPTALMASVRPRYRVMQKAPKALISAARTARPLPTYPAYAVLCGMGNRGLARTLAVSLNVLLVGTIAIQLPPLGKTGRRFEPLAG
jgi:hypothetical protein